jgi:hypothetical protein
VSQQIFQAIMARGIFPPIQTSGSWAAQRLHPQIVRRRREVSMKFTVASVAAVCVAVVIGVSAGAAARAESGQDKMGPDKMGPDKMGKMDVHDQSYTGCVEAGKTPRTYVLTHIAKADDHMGKDAMAKDAMAKDSMGMSKGEMSPASLVISSKAVDLSQQVGHKVTVSGTAPAKADAMGKDSMGMAPDGPAFTIKTLKVIGSSCQ